VWRRARAAGGSEDASEAIVAEISAQEIGGQIAVGSHNLQIHADHGAIVYAMPPGQAPGVRARPQPVLLQPRDFADLLGRDREVTRLLAELAGDEPVTIAGAAGVGKTSLLRRLSHLAAGAVADSVVFLRAAGQPLLDVERFLFDAYYESDAPYQPTPAELRRRLAACRGLVVLDDVDQERDDVCELFDCASGCRFLLASERRELWSEGRTIALDGLDEAAALRLFERELGRPLGEHERALVEDLCRRVEGSPLRIRQAAALARDGDLSPASAQDVEDAARARLDDAERRVLQALQLLAPAAVHVDDVAAIADVPDAAAVLERLRARGAAQAHSPRWSATLPSPQAPGGGEREALLLRRARERLALGIEERPVEDVPVILAALRAGGDGGAPGRRGARALARAADPLLTRSGRWGAWEAALERTLTAAEADGDRAAAAWALHQLGTRAGCLGERSGAARLERALALRRSLGDERGAAVTSHNLALLFGALPGGGGQHGTQPPSWPPRLGRWLGLGGGVLAVGAAIALLLGSDDRPAASSARPAAVASAQTQTQTVTETQRTATGTTPAGGRAASSGGVPSKERKKDEPTPAQQTRLAIDGTAVFEANPDGLEENAMTVTNRGPIAIALVPSVGDPFRASAKGCPNPFEVGESCRVFVDYVVGPETVTATLRFADSPDTMTLTGLGSGPSTDDSEPATEAGPATTTTTAPVAPPSTAPASR
jgi:hypothetical protein